MTPRVIPRRILFAVPFNMEFEVTEVRLHELGDVVDLFMFGESNYSSHGDPKTLRLLEALKSGFAREHQHKILHVLLDYFDKEGLTNGWVAEALMRNHIGERGVKYQLVGTRPDDLIILTDADEIPKKEVILFLKNHDGIPEPFGFTLHAYVFGFYWSGGRQGKISVNGGCTLGMLRSVLQYKTYPLRNPKGLIFGAKEIASRLTTYTKSARTTSVVFWVIGEGKVAVGWHCSYCFKPEWIRVKLISAQNGDFPRWGDFPDKLNLIYLRSLIFSGKDFNGKSSMQRSPIDEAHVPRYVLDNSLKFVHLLNKSFYDKPADSFAKPVSSLATQTTKGPTSHAINTAREKKLGSSHGVSLGTSVQHLRKYLNGMRIEHKESYQIIMDVLGKFKRNERSRSRVIQIENLLNDLLKPGAKRKL